MLAEALFGSGPYPEAWISKQRHVLEEKPFRDIAAWLSVQSSPPSSRATLLIQGLSWSLRLSEEIFSQRAIRGLPRYIPSAAAAPKPPANLHRSRYKQSEMLWGEEDSLHILQLRLIHKCQLWTNVRTAALADYIAQTLNPTPNSRITLQNQFESVLPAHRTHSF